MKLVVTGDRGFIGSHFVEEALKRGHFVIGIDSLTYAANKELPYDKNNNYKQIIADISALDFLPHCDVIVNFASETHVDNSITAPQKFIKSNFLGVFNLLELVRGKREFDRPLFFQISTDEVYGDILNGEFSELDKLSPSNPYAASKAAAELLIQSFSRTYGLRYMITRTSNNYGARQYEEKLIPRTIEAIKYNNKVPMHGTGKYIRDWIYVQDNVDALFKILENTAIKPFDNGHINEIFNIAARNYMTNEEIVTSVFDYFGIKNKEDYIEYVENRWGQDLRYAISTDKIENKLNWKPKHTNLFLDWIEK